MKESMTPKERWLAAVQMEPVDRIPVWAKLGSSYPKYQKEPFRNMRISELQRYVGSDCHEWIPSSGRLVLKTELVWKKIIKTGISLLNILPNTVLV